jgi:hypothetical protein
MTTEFKTGVFAVPFTVTEGTAGVATTALVESMIATVLEFVLAATTFGELVPVTVNVATLL